MYWSNPNWRQQEAERIRRLNEEHAARINQDAMDRLRGTGAYAPTSTGRSWLDYELERNPNYRANLSAQNQNSNILNHPEILKRRQFNSQFNDVNHAREWLQRSGYSV